MKLVSLAAAVVITALVVAAPGSAALTKLSGPGPAAIVPNAYGPTAGDTGGALGSPVLAFDTANGVNAATGKSKVNVLIRIESDGSLSLYSDSSVGAYESVEDVLVGVENLSSTAWTAGITLTGSSDIYGWDGDGIDDYLKAAVTSGNTLDTSANFANTSTTPASDRYGGPITYFTGISANKFSGTVNFQGGLAAGATTYFSLEGTPANVNGGIIVAPAAAPEPTSMVMAASGALLLLGYGWRRRKVAVTA